MQRRIKADRLVKITNPNLTEPSDIEKIREIVHGMFVLASPPFYVDAATLLKAMNGAWEQLNTLKHSSEAFKNLEDSGIYEQLEEIYFRVCKNLKDMENGGKVPSSLFEKDSEVLRKIFDDLQSENVLE